MSRFAVRARQTGFALVLAATLVPVASYAAIFEDGEARRAILEMRSRVDNLQQTTQRSSEELRKLTDENAQLRKSLLEFQSQIDILRVEQAKLRGQNEQLLRDAADLQRRQKDIAQGVDERLRQFEPVVVTVDGVEFQADPNEKREFDNALAVFRAGTFPEAVAAFSSFTKQYPRSGFEPSARFWLGNAQYATREYRDAIANFRLMLSQSPKHARAPEAALSIASCQVELKDSKGARKTLEDLVRAYPQSEAAIAAKERLSRLK